MGFACDVYFIISSDLSFLYQIIYLPPSKKTNAPKQLGSLQTAGTK